MICFSVEFLILIGWRVRSQSVQGVKQTICGMITVSLDL